MPSEAKDIVWLVVVIIIHLDNVSCQYLNIQNGEIMDEMDKHSGRGA